MGPESLTPEIARQLAQGSVAALKPGDVLAVRVRPGTNGAEMHHLRLRAEKIEAETGVKVAFIPGEEFAHVTLNVTVNVTAATPEQIAEAVRREIDRQVRAARTRDTGVRATIAE
jgi:acetylornithine deacetylase/succinyl-diaminopimelate desuccinylase-like protein